MRKGIFFCDIEGTLTGGKEEQFGMFFENLEDLMVKDELVFKIVYL